MRRSLWIALLGLPIATIVAATVADQTYVSMAGHGHDYWRIFLWQWLSWTFWAAVAPVVILAGTTWRRLLLFAVGCILAHTVVAAATSVLVQPYLPITTFTFRSAFFGQLRGLIPVDVIACLWLGLVGWAWSAREKASRLQLRETRLEGDLVRAQLDALRLEIQPHFLFNTLNAATALIRQRENERALDMLVGLSELMRDTLDRGNSQVVPFAIELAMTQRYVDLQRARYGERLDVVYAIEPGCTDVPVPAFLIQPVIENAIRHGVARVARTCRIELQAALTPDGRLSLSIADDGPGLPADFDMERHARTGLRNIRARLEGLYGPDATLAICGSHRGGVAVTVCIPAHVAAA